MSASKDGAPRMISIQRRVFCIILKDCRVWGEEGELCFSTASYIIIRSG
jgi:hypothetical protein